MEIVLAAGVGSVLLTFSHLHNRILISLVILLCLDHISVVNATLAIVQIDVPDLAIFAVNLLIQVDGLAFYVCHLLPIVLSLSSPFAHDELTLMDVNLFRVVHSNDLFQSVKSRSPGLEFFGRHNDFFVLELGLISNFLVD